MSDWKTKTLGEVTSYIAKGIPPKYVEEVNDDTICVLNQKCNKNFRISYADSRLHNNAAKKVSDVKMLKPGDVLINSTGTGTAGRVAQIWDIEAPTTIDGHMILMRPTDEVDPLYYGYAVKAFQAEIESYAEGSTGQTEINKTRLQNETIIMYPVDKGEQYRIARILAAIDEKILLNEEVNKNLEQQAAAYFHHQFIVNAAPSWKEGTISDLGTVIGGSTPSKSKPEYYTDNGIAWITPKDLSVDKSKFISHGADDITELGLRNSSASIMPAGTVLFSSRAPIGYIAIADGEVTTNQGFKSVVPNGNVGTAFVYYFLKNALPTIENMASGSTFKEISGSAMRTVPAVIPDDGSLQEFSDFCEPLFQQQRTLEAENHSLAALRDSLLPKLMSGELDVSELDL